MQCNNQILIICVCDRDCKDILSFYRMSSHHITKSSARKSEKDTKPRVLSSSAKDEINTGAVVLHNPKSEIRHIVSISIEGVGLFKLIETELVCTNGTFEILSDRKGVLSIRGGANSSNTNGNISVVGGNYVFSSGMVFVNGVNINQANNAPVDRSKQIKKVSVLSANLINVTLSGGAHLLVGTDVPELNMITLSGVTKFAFGNKQISKTITLHVSGVSNALICANIDKANINCSGTSCVKIESINIFASVNCSGISNCYIIAKKSANIIENITRMSKIHISTDNTPVNKRSNYDDVD
jgi:hypothetical protein